MTKANLGYLDPVQLSAEDVGEEEPVQLSAEDVGEEEPVQLSAEDVGEEGPVQLSEEEALAADRSRPGFLRRAVGETLTQLADVGRQSAAGVVRDLPRMLWQTAAAALPGETPSAANPQGSGAAGFAGQVADEIDAREKAATWDDPLRSGAAGIPGMAARSAAPNLLAALATRGQSVRAMPFVYGAARGQDVFRRMRDEAERTGVAFDADKARVNAFGAAGLEGGLEYVSSLFGLGKAAREFGTALKAGRPIVSETLSKGLAAGLRKLAGEMLSEAGTEFVQEGGGELHEQLLGISDALEGRADSVYDVDWQAVAEAAALGAGAGAVGAGGMGGIAAGAQSLGRRMANSAELRAALRERAAGDAALRASDGTAAEVDRERTEGGMGEGTPNAERRTPNAEGRTGEDRTYWTDKTYGGMYGEGAQDGEPQAGEDGPGAGARAAQEAAAQAGGTGGAEVAAAEAAALTLPDGARIEALETRPGRDGRQIKGVRLLMPDGRSLWAADAGETALAEYWLKDRMEFPPAPAGDRGRQAGDPRVNASRRAGFDVAPGKGVLVELGRSKKPYPAVVVEVLDDTHVRVRVAKIQRALKNNRSGYADIDVRQTREYRSAAAKRGHDEEMRRAGLGAQERARARKDAAEFDRLLLEGDEIADQLGLEYAASLPGKAAGVARSEETAKARLRAAAMLETDEDLSTPLGRARALPLLRRLLEDMRAGEDPAGELETPEELWLERFRQEAEAESAALEREPLILDDMTIDEQDAELERVRAARERAAQREELARRAAAPLTGSAGDMTGTLPGMEGVSDVPLFTENQTPDLNVKVLSDTPDKFEMRGNIDMVLERTDTSNWGRPANVVIPKTVFALHSLEVANERDKGKGLGTKALNIAKKYAVKNSIPIYLEARANDDGKQKDLNRFYEQNGFKRIDGLQDTFLWYPAQEQRHELFRSDEGSSGELFNMAPGARPRTVAPGPSSVYGQDSGGAGAAAQTARTAAPASGLPVEEGPQERRGVGMDMRDAVQMYRELTGMLPRIREKLRAKGALGLFRPGTREIELLAGIFGLVDAQDEAAIRQKQAEKGLAGTRLEEAVSRELAALVETRRREVQKRPLKVLVHELAHLVDYLPDGMVRGRGNILGHIAGLKRHLAGAIAPAPGQPGPLTDAEKGALRREAEKEMRAALGEARTIIEEITREVPEFRTVGITAEDVKALLGESGGRGTPELYQWFAAQDSITKREIMIRALKGVVDERAARAAGARMEATGRTVTETARVSRTVPGYTAADGRRRFRELLREETARRRLVERDAVVAEAESLIPWWRGLAEMEDYFRKPEEMYAELFGIFLADPKALEERAPTTFRAFTGWMNARPSAKRAHDAYLQSRDDGTAGLKHAERLEETMRKQYEADWQETQDRLNRPTWGEKWDQFRMHFDRRRAPYQAALARINRMQLAEAKDPAERKRLHEENMRGLALAKRESRGGNVLKIFLQKMTGNVESRLSGAGLDMVSLGKYLALRRVAFELDGRAGPLGFDTASSIKELDEWRVRLGAEAGPWSELEKSGVEFRALIEELMIKDPDVRAMLGAETMAMIEKNTDYVTFSHVPIKEQVQAFKADLAKAGGDMRLLSEDSMAFVSRQIDRRAGTELSPQIFQLKGSFDPIANPVVATIQKCYSIRRAAHRNAMKRHMHELAEKSGYGGVLKAEWEYDQKAGKQMPVMVDNRRWKTVVYMDGGELKAFTANRPLAESLESDKAADSELLNFGVRWNNKFKALLTSQNYAFIFTNNMRDLQRAAGNVQGLWRSPLVFAPGGQFVTSMMRHAPEAFVRSLPSWIVNDNQIEWYLPAAHAAARLAVRGNWAEAQNAADRLQAEGKTRQAEFQRRIIALARTGLEKGFLMSHIEAIHAEGGAGDWERMLHRAGVRKIEADKVKGMAAGLAGWFRGKAERAAEFVQEKGETGEHTTKLATLSFLMDKRADMGMDEKLMVVTEWGGSPDFGEYGTWSRYLEAATAPFFNAAKEGTLGSVRAFKDHPGEWALKKSVYVVAPAMMRWMLYSGAGMAAVAALYPDPEERDRLPFWHFLQWCYRTGRNIPDYYQKNYITHSLPIDPGNPDVTVTISMPMDQGDQQLSILTCNLMEWATGWDAGKADAPLAQSIAALSSGLLPDGVGNAPVLAMLGLVKGYFMGTNYKDTFTGKEVWTQPEMDTRFSVREHPEALKALLGELSNRAGGGMFWRYRRDNPTGPEMPRLNEFLNLPIVQPSLGRYIHLFHSGEAQAIARLEGIEDKVRAPMVLQARTDFARAVREGGGNGLLNISEDITERMAQDGGAYYADEFQRLNVRYQNERTHNPLMDAWAKSKDPTVRKRFDNLYRLKIMAEE